MSLYRLSTTFSTLRLPKSWNITRIHLEPGFYGLPKKSRRCSLPHVCCFRSIINSIIRSLFFPLNWLRKKWIRSPPGSKIYWITIIMSPLDKSNPFSQPNCSKYWKIKIQTNLITSWGGIRSMMSSRESDYCFLPKSVLQSSRFPSRMQLILFKFLRSKGRLHSWWRFPNIFAHNDAW